MLILLFVLSSSARPVAHSFCPFCRYEKAHLVHAQIVGATDKQTDLVILTAQLLDK